MREGAGNIPSMKCPGTFKRIGINEQNVLYNLFKENDND
jgi:hypothetical protein